MRIESFYYHDKALDWELKEMSFSDLTLLVGISGVGKTRILKALLNIKRISEGKPINGIKWEIKFTTKEGAFYRWCGEYEQLSMLHLSFFDDEDEKTSEKPKIISEFLYLENEEIVIRDRAKIIFDGNQTPKLSPTSSIISLLSNEDKIKPASKAFNRIVESEQLEPRGFIFRYDNYEFEELVQKYNTLEKIQESNMPVESKLALVYKSLKDVFMDIKNRFIEIFPQVEDLIIEPKDEYKIPFFLSKVPILQIQEKGVSKWIEKDKISSGMLKTLFHIADMYLWPEGTVILIDEFENSLGVNCIDVLTEDLLKQDRKLQFILTSHHPYIINNISTKYWKIVQRRGGVVTTHDADTLGLSNSSHEAFIQLINSDSYREGIVV